MKCIICEKEYPRTLGQHIQNEHGMTSEEYYFKYISSHVPDCKKCGQPLKFVKLSRPFYSTCSKSCKSSIVMTRMNHDKEFQQKASDGLKRRIETDRDYREKLILQCKRNSEKVQNSPEIQKKIKESRFEINNFRRVEMQRLIRLDENAGRTKRYFYIADCGNFLKFGSTADLTHRKRNLENELGHNIEFIFVVNLFYIEAAELEHDIILELTKTFKLFENSGLSFGQSECFEKSDSLIEFVNQIISNISSSTTSKSL